MIRFAVIGTGHITTKMINGGKLCPAFELKGVYSRDKARAKAFAAEYGAPLSFDNLDDLAGCDQIDAIYIASPTSFHGEHAVKMLGSGKHVLCEKPAVSNLAELKQVLDVAKANDRIFLEAMRPDFGPGFLWIKENLSKLGTIRRATLIYCQYSSRYDNYKKGVLENAFRPELSNGALMDIGVYPLHMLVSLFGRPESIKASGVHLPGSIDGAGTILAQYPQMLGDILYSKITDSAVPSEIQGEEGNLTFTPGGMPEKIAIHYRDGRVEQPDLPASQWDLCYEVQAFCEMVQGKRQPAPYHRITLETMALLDAARSQMGIRFPADLN